MGTVIRRRPGRAMLLVLALVLGIGLLVLLPHRATGSVAAAHQIFETMADCVGREGVVTGYGDYWDQPTRAIR